MKHGWWILPSFAAGVVCLVLFIPYMMRDGIAAASLLLAVGLLAMIGLGVAVWLTGR